MIRGPETPEPRRLTLSDDRAAQLLREADQAYRHGLVPGPSWKRLQARRQRREILPFAALVVAAVALVVLAQPRLARRAESSVVSLTAERLPPRPPPSRNPQREAAQRRIPPPDPARHSTVSSIVPTPVTRPASRERPAVATESICRNWSSQAHYERAVDCFLAISREPGLSAEVALYEAARLSAETLLDPERALSLLDQHHQRFPNSVLRVEVDWLRVRSLERAGRLVEALKSSEALLDSAAARALIPQIHLLRGRIYAESQKDCGHAVQEYVALLGEPGAAGDEAELRRAQCLETLRNVSAARAAYEHYLVRGAPQRAAFARERLLALSTLELPTKGEP